MTLAEQLDDDLKAAMRAHEAGTVACIRSVKAKVKEATTAKGFTGPVDDALHRRVIVAYVKQLKNALPELEAGGDKGRALIESYGGEIAYLERYLPKLLGRAETTEIVRKVIADTGVTDAKRAGQVMGAVMKQHRESVDPALVKAIVEQLLRSA
ncbi:MAG: GatB/YqeY domain-containing protein [Candidatus Binatia bacterium]